MDITGKDNELLRVISDSAFNAGAITNKALQEKLIGTDWSKGLTGKKLSSKISRQIRCFVLMLLSGSFPISTSML
ncbi:MAG: hypothetical protein Q8942_19620 [Bacillota bacterium]|nr:hypothetical protein [Bacillota bacterium]